MARAKRTERAEARRRYRAAAPDGGVRRRRRRASAVDCRANGRSAQPEGGRRGITPADGLRGRVPAAIRPLNVAPTWPPCPGSRPTPMRSGYPSRSPWPARSRSSSPRVVTSRCSCSRTSSRRRRSVACSSLASWHRGPAGSLARSSASSRRSVTPCSSWRIRPRSTRPRRRRPSPGPGGRALGLRPVADHRGLLRGRRRVVPPLPAAVESEPGPPGTEVEHQEDG